MAQLANITIKGESAQQVALAQDRLIAGFKIIEAIKLQDRDKGLPAEQGKVNGNDISHSAASSKRVGDSGASHISK
jgi:hypothetical protein